MVSSAQILSLAKFRVGRPVRSMKCSYGCRGFTLIETMVVVAIIAILAALAAPSFTDLLRKNRLSAASSALQVSLSLARSEAIKRGADARVTVAAKTTAGAFENGWVVFVDGTNNANSGLAPTADTSVAPIITRLEVVGAPAGPVTFNNNGNAINYFIYNGKGRLITSTGASANRSVWFSDSTSEKYCVILNITGRVRVARVASSANCVND